jgi:predicted NBD/HSP70 family sugar kinase
LEARPIPTWSRATADSRRQIIALLLERGALSRADLARLTRLNKPTISNVVARLIDEGIVQEIGSGSSTGGRKPILLSIQETSRLAVGVEIDASVCRFLLVTLHGERLVTLDAPRETSSIESVVEAIATGLDQLFIDQYGDALLGCGIAVPGLVDRVNDTVDSPMRLGWSNVPLRSLLEARLNVPVLVTDRGKAAGLGEMWVLGKEQAHDLIYLYLGNGVAGAVVLGRELHWGVSNIAGEIGHMTVDPDGPVCSCGNRGCLESLVSTPAILERAQQSLFAHPDSSLAHPITVAAIGAAAAGGDPLAGEIVDATARWIGIALANLINALNPATVVLGGPTAEWGEVLIDAINREIDARALPLSRQAAEIVTGKAGDLATPLGAAALVLQQAAELIAHPRKARASMQSVA